MACCALLVRQSISVRQLHSKQTAVQGWDALQGGRSISRGLQQLILEDDDDDNDEGEAEHLSPEPQAPIAGISRFGIHGEGWSNTAHNLLESDSEVLELAGAIVAGNAHAEGRGVEGGVDDSPDSGTSQNDNVTGLPSTCHLIDCTVQGCEKPTSGRCPSGERMKATEQYFVLCLQVLKRTKKRGMR